MAKKPTDDLFEKSTMTFGEHLEELRSRAEMDNMRKQAVADVARAHKYGIERFANLRAEAWWRFREALDPATGADIALPPDPELAAELAMPRRVPEKREIQIESKEQIIKRLGRSPDKADAVVQSWAYGSERALDRLMPQRLQTRQNVGYDSAKRRRYG
jgi:hypothetical protein